LIIFCEKRQKFYSKTLSIHQLGAVILFYIPSVFTFESCNKKSTFFVMLGTNTNDFGKRHIQWLSILKFIQGKQEYLNTFFIPTRK